MSGRDEIDYREKFLDLIQETSEKGRDASVFQTALPEFREKARGNVFPEKFGHISHDIYPSFISKILSFRERITIGVDLGSTSLKFVKFSAAAAQNRRLTDYLSMPCRGKHLPQILQSALKNLCSASKKNDIWAVIPLDNFDTRYLTVPKVSRKELSNAVYWAYKKLNSLDEEEFIFDYELIGDISDKGIRKYAVMVYTASRREIEKIQNIFSGTGFPLAGITTYPFALQNLMKAQYIRTGGQDVCCVYVGMNWSRIDIFFAKGNLVLSRRIRSCMASMLEELRGSLQAVLHLSSASGGKKNKVQRPEEASAAPETDPARDIFFALIRGVPDLNRILAENNLNISSEEIFGMLIPAIERLVWKVERTIEAYQTDTGDRELGKIFISGEISGSAPVIDYIGKRLKKDIETREPDPFICDFVMPGMPVPDLMTERVSYVPAAGVALSKNFFTPNFIYTYLEKDRYMKSRQTDHAVFIVFALIAFLCLGLCFYQDHIIRHKNKILRANKDAYAVQKEKQKGIVFDPILISTMKDRIIAQRMHTEKFTQMYTATGIIGILNELSDQYSVSLKNLHIHITEFPKEGKDPQGKEKHKGSFMELEGIILTKSGLTKSGLTESGENLSDPEIRLTAYQMAMKKNQIFSSVMQKPVPDNKKNSATGAALIFRLYADIAQQ
ncbi:MAG: hypothetical protein V2I97_16925 [Desulfococcaceae bacterium]|nr:hypothetical protein [Desulfococcaceae bacterium]